MEQIDKMQKIIDAAIEQIKIDVKHEDFSAIEELFTSIDSDILYAFLSIEEQEKLDIK